jgi:hypothetical protein
MVYVRRQVNTRCTNRLMTKLLLLAEHLALGMVQGKMLNSQGRLPVYIKYRFRFLPLASVGHLKAGGNCQRRGEVKKIPDRDRRKGRQSRKRAEIFAEQNQGGEQFFTA